MRHTALTAPFRVASFDFADPPLAERWRDVTLPVVAAGFAHAVAFWFDLELDDDIVVSSGPGGTLRHWDQAVQYLDEGRQVVPGDGIELTVGHTDTRIYFQLKAAAADL